MSRFLVVVSGTKNLAGLVLGEPACKHAIWIVIHMASAQTWKIEKTDPSPGMSRIGNLPPEIRLFLVNGCWIWPKVPAIFGPGKARFGYPSSIGLHEKLTYPWHITQIGLVVRSYLVPTERLLHKPWDAAQVGAATGQPAMEKTRAATANATCPGDSGFHGLSWSFYWGIEWWSRLY